ncbi:uncharacterized protein [Centruroides vittatus]|uniref:uncharacterized protein isoform X1 n=1 Tax=Centruroides vittatus TaxID=120091 RepID=UPI003510B930
MVVQENLTPVEGNRAPSKHEKKHRLKQRFEVVKKLGQGTYGKVQLAINKETEQEVAIKTIKKSKIESEQDLIRIRREIQIMSSIQHPHIIHIYEVFENKEKIVLVMQYASGGELYDYLSQKKILNDVEARRIFRQIAAAVYYCHKNKICHRDLKLENVLLDEKGNAKIADFGLSNVYDEKHLLDTFCGSPLYASPEIVKGVPYYGPEVDCWSMGVILYTLVYGAMPFDGSNFKRLVKQISEGDYYEPTTKAEASNLIHRLLNVNPSKRATIIDICSDSWVNEGYEHSLLQVSEDLANLTPVRIDLLLALAPASPEEGNTQNPLAASDGKSKLPNDDDADTITDSFTFTDGKADNEHNASIPNLPNLEEDEEFLPANVAAELDEQCAKRQAERSFDGSLMKISSIAHKNKKPKKSTSVNLDQPKETEISNQQSKQVSQEVGKDQNNNDNISETSKEPSTVSEKVTENENKTVKPDNEEKNKAKSVKTDKTKDITAENKNETGKKPISGKNEKNESSKRKQSVELNKTDEEKVATHDGRKPGKVTIPKFLESAETSPTKFERRTSLNETQSEQKAKKEKVKESEKETKKVETPDSSESHQENQSSENANSPEKTSENEDNSNKSEAKKVAAKGILKKNIAKARLLEKRLSQQSSVESNDPSSPPVDQSNISPPLNVESPDVTKGPSFFKVPQPYSKTTKEKPIQSKAEIVFSNQENSSKEKNSSQTEKSLVHFSQNHEETESIWGTPLSPPIKNEKNNQALIKHSEWNNISSDICEDNWKQVDDDNFACVKQGPTPITRSYKKFTFTKEGTCITETGKIYTKPGADGSWTKVEKKTKITTLPGTDEFQKFEHVQVRDESLSRSDSQSSSESNDIFDDIFDSWTGDSMMCNFMKIKDNMRKFSKRPLFWRERHRDPFRQFKTERQQSKEWSRQNDKRYVQSSERESSDNEDEFDIHFDDMHPVVYGSQGLWQLMMSVNKDLPHHLRSFRDPPQMPCFTRSVSRNRGAALLQKQNQLGSRGSTGYSTRSLSRERSQSPRETVLRFVLESPQRQQSVNVSEPDSPQKQEAWNCKDYATNAQERRSRKDSGVESCTSTDSDGIRRLYSRDETRYSSFDDGFGPKTFHQYVKSKNSAERHGSFEEEYPQSPFDNLADSRRHRVEQWLHMTDVPGFDSPFEEFVRLHDLSAHNENPTSSIYGTMRPRDYMRYNRSMSDKLTDIDAPFNDQLHEPQHSQSNQSLEKQSNKSYRSEISVDSTGKVQSSTVKTVTETNYPERMPIHSNSGNSFNVKYDSDGNNGRPQVTSNPQNSTKYTRSYSGNLQFAGPQEGVTSRGTNRPILSMTVSFNRGNPDGSVIVQSNTRTPGSTGGVWQQQEFTTAPGRVTIRREFSDPTSETANVTTIPVQRYYSTQESNRSNVENLGQPRGKYFNSELLNPACSGWRMASTNNSTKQFSYLAKNITNDYVACLKENSASELKEENTLDIRSDGTLTPDSLETSSVKDENEPQVSITAPESVGLWKFVNNNSLNKEKMIETEYKQHLLISERNEVSVKLQNAASQTRVSAYESSLTSVHDKDSSQSFPIEKTAKICDINLEGCVKEEVNSLIWDNKTSLESCTYKVDQEMESSQHAKSFQQFSKNDSIGISVLEPKKWATFDQNMLMITSKLKHS